MILRFLYRKPHLFLCALLLILFLGYLLLTNLFFQATPRTVILQENMQCLGDAIHRSLLENRVPPGFLSRDTKRTVEFLKGEFQKSPKPKVDDFIDISSKQKRYIEITILQKDMGYILSAQSGCLEYDAVLSTLRSSQNLTQVRRIIEEKGVPRFKYDRLAECGSVEKDKEYIQFTNGLLSVIDYEKGGIFLWYRVPLTGIIR